MKVLSVSVGLPTTVVGSDGEEVSTAIFKTPVAGRLAVDTQGLDGDRQADRENHGGENKAVYAYPSEYYVYWQHELGRRELEPAQFGENLTIEGLDEAVGIGDVFRVGSAELQVAQPRKPCFKLGIRVGDPTFVKRFHRSGRTGFYLRVLRPGDIGPGDPIEQLDAGTFGFSVRSLWHLVYERRDGADEARRALEIPWLAEEFRRPLLRRLRDGALPG